MRGLLQFLVLPASAVALAPRHSWDYVANMTFFHSCNESGLFIEEALDTIARFPMVTIEKGQGSMMERSVTQKRRSSSRFVL